MVSIGNENGFLAQSRKLKIAEKTGISISSQVGEQLKSFIRPSSMVVGGIIQMAIGLVLVIQPELDFTHLIDTQFLDILRIFGVIIISEGSLHLVRGIIGNQQITKHQIIIGIKIFLSIMNIPLLVILMEQPELVPFVPFEDFLIRGFFGFVIVMVIIGAFSNGYKAVTLEKYRIEPNKLTDKTI